MCFAAQPCKRGSQVKSVNRESARMLHVSGVNVNAEKPHSPPHAIEN